MADDIITPAESVLPSVMHTKRWLVIETLLKRLDGLAKHTLVMLFDTVNETALDHLADQFSLTGNDGWAFVKSVEQKRELLKASIEIHRYKGTVWALRRTLSIIGFGDCEINERFNFMRHDRSINHDGSRSYPDTGSWTHYALRFDRPISHEEAEQIRIVAKDIAPLRCKLVSISHNPLKYDASIQHNAKYSRGEYRF